MAPAARPIHAALAELVEAQREYDAALADLARRRASKPGGASDAPAPEIAIIRARESALHAARAFERAYGAMQEAHTEFERTLDLLAEARKRIQGAGGTGEEALERAERILAAGRARLIAAGEALARERDRL